MEYEQDSILAHQPHFAETAVPPSVVAGAALDVVPSSSDVSSAHGGGVRFGLGLGFSLPSGLLVI